MFWTNVLIDVLLFFFVVVCLLMCLVVLMQRSKQEASARRSAAASRNRSGARKPRRVLVKATVWLAALFFIFSISLARLYSNRASQMEKGSPVQQELLKPVASAVAAPAATTPATNAPAAVASPASGLDQCFGAGCSGQARRQVTLFMSCRAMPGVA